MDALLGVEKLPAATASAAPGPAGEYLSADPQGKAVAEEDAAGQKYPAWHGSVHTVVRCTELEYVPAGHAMRTPPMQ